MTDKAIEYGVMHTPEFAVSGDLKATYLELKKKFESTTQINRTEEIKALWESTPSGAIEAGISGNSDKILAKALECMNWITDFQLKYKNEFRPFEGLSAIIGEE